MISRKYKIIFWGKVKRLIDIRERYGYYNDFFSSLKEYANHKFLEIANENGVLLSNTPRKF